MKIWVLFKTLIYISNVRYFVLQLRISIIYKGNLGTLYNRSKHFRNRGRIPFCGYNFIAKWLGNSWNCSVILWNFSYYFTIIQRRKEIFKYKLQILDTVYKVIQNLRLFFIKILIWYTIIKICWIVNGKVNCQNGHPQNPLWQKNN